MEGQTKEPEELVSSAKYLLELIQMDLNFGRKETVPARARAALLNLIDLSKIFSFEKEEEIKKEDAEAYYSNHGFSSNLPDQVGLWAIVCAETNWSQSLVAITKNDYQILTVHCPDVGENSLEQYHGNLESPMWKRLA